MTAALGTSIDPDKAEALGLIPGHAYSVLQVVEPAPSVRLVQVRNPWGHTEWKGAFSDGSSDWTPALAAAVGLVRSSQDGAFFMPFKIFVEIFNVETCSPAATHPVAVTVRGQVRDANAFVMLGRPFYVKLTRRSMQPAKCATCHV